MKDNMRRYTVHSLILLFMGIQTYVYGQQIKPSESFIVHEDVPRSCWVVNLDPEPKTLKKAWKDYVKDEFDISMKGFGLFLKKDLLFAELKSDMFANSTSHAPAFRALREIMEDFLAEYLPVYYHSRVTDAEERMLELAEEREI
jgi:hypothetical protein